MMVQLTFFPRAALAAVFCLLAVSPAAAQDIQAGRAKAQACAACHGVDRNSASGQFPPMAAPLSREDMIDIANYYAAQPLKPSAFKADERKAQLGKAKADETLCTMCHLGGFAGQNEIPRVAGQQYDYIVQQLRDFKARKR